MTGFRSDPLARVFMYVWVLFAEAWFRARLLRPLTVVLVCVALAMVAAGWTWDCGGGGCR